MINCPDAVVCKPAQDLSRQTSPYRMIHFFSSKLCLPFFENKIIFLLIASMFFWGHRMDLSYEIRTFLDCFEFSFQNFSRTGSVPATQSIKVCLKAAIFPICFISFCLRITRKTHGDVSSARRVSATLIYLESIRRKSDFSRLEPTDTQRALKVQYSDGGTQSFRGISCLSLCLYGIKAPIIYPFCASCHNNTLKGTFYLP